MFDWWKAYRSIDNHPVWRLPASHFKVWFAILNKVNYVEKEWLAGSDRIPVKPGTFITSQEHLAEYVGVSRRVIQKAIANLIRLDSIRVKTRFKRWSEITVVNWETYQAQNGIEVQQEVQERFKSGSSQVHDLRRKEGKKVREEELPCEASASRNGHEARAVLEFLNRKAGRNFRESDVNLDLIRARLKSGIHDWQLKAIVSRKIAEWRGTEQEKYLRPATLFNKTKCEQYLGELPKEDSGDLSGVREGVAPGEPEMLVRMEGTATTH